jgi:CheY-like chemotaxis protein
MPKKILIVDDDRVNTTLIRFSLKEQRYEVECAEDGVQALDAVKRWQPDLVVLDVQMPRMSGFEFMNELKTFPGNNIPVIMLTANDNMQDIFFAEGVKGYFVKPVDPVKLEAKIRSCLGLD